MSVWTTEEIQPLNNLNQLLLSIHSQQRQLSALVDAS